MTHVRACRKTHLWHILVRKHFRSWHTNIDKRIYLLLYSDEDARSQFVIKGVLIKGVLLHVLYVYIYKYIYIYMQRLT